MNELEANRRFIKESLPLLVSYFYSEDVSLEPTEVDVAEEGEADYVTFGRLLRMRHAIACGLRLKPIIEAIKRGISQTSEIIRADVKGVIKGRLDIPLYLNRRGTNLSWPRSFPVLLTDATPDTPENKLIVDSFRRLIWRLAETGVTNVSAERSYCLNLLRWGREELHSEPWARVVPNRSPIRLHRETSHRLRKRQTGNEPAYARFLGWYKQWDFDPSRSNPEESDEFVNLLLAFPPGEFFEDRVFEIWCLHQAIESFRRCGGDILNGPRPLASRSEHPICELKYGDYHLQIWFQKALPTASARWEYLHSHKPLIGIPDITVVGEDGRRLLIDAKRRMVRGQTRAEETYKMLGYSENYRELFEIKKFWGVLCFLSDDALFTELSTEDAEKLVLIGAHPDNPEICAFGGRMDTVISEWLYKPPSADAEPIPHWS